MENLLLILPGIIAVLLVVLIWNTARRNKGPIGHLVRWWWNTSFKIAAYIPFCGWMAHFIFKDDPTKKGYVEIGENTDKTTQKYFEQKAAQEKAEEAARQNQQLAWEKMQEELRGRAYRELGTRDVHLSKDGTRVKVGDSDYMPVEEFKRKLYK